MNILGSMLFGSISGSAVARRRDRRRDDAVDETRGLQPRIRSGGEITSAPIGLLRSTEQHHVVYSLASGGVSIARCSLPLVPGIVLGAR